MESLYTAARGVLRDAQSRWARSSASRVLRSRLTASAALAVASASAIVLVSYQLNAVTVVDGELSRVVFTMENDPKAAVASADVELLEGDEVVAADSRTVEVNRASDVQVTADGISTIVRLAGGTVSDALERVGVTLGADDQVNVALNQEIGDGLDITVDRIAYQEYTETETIPCTSTVYKTNTLAPGRTLVKQSGRNGSVTRTYRRTIKNGKLIDTKVLSETVNQSMVGEVKLVGMPKGQPLVEVPGGIALDSKGQPVNYKKVFTGKATAYSNDRGKAGKYTASGRRAAVGVVAVDPNKIPYGTKLYIVSADGSYCYGYAIAGDTGGALRSGAVLVDLFFSHYEECLKFGAKALNVYVIG